MTLGGGTDLGAKLYGVASLTQLYHFWVTEVHHTTFLGTWAWHVKLLPAPRTPPPPIPPTGVSDGPSNPIHQQTSMVEVRLRILFPSDPGPVLYSLPTASYGIFCIKRMLIWLLLWFIIWVNQTIICIFSNFCIWKHTPEFMTVSIKTSSFFCSACR